MVRRVSLPASEKYVRRRRERMPVVNVQEEKGARGYATTFTQAAKLFKVSLLATSRCLRYQLSNPETI